LLLFLSIIYEPEIYVGHIITIIFWKNLLKEGFSKCFLQSFSRAADSSGSWTFLRHVETWRRPSKIQKRTQDLIWIRCHCWKVFNLFLMWDENLLK
jgi:hypothetical protein